MGRRVLELVSRSAAGVIDETEDYYWARVLDRFEMYCMKDDKSLTPCLTQDGYWESWITLWFMNNIRPGTVVYDVGANSGYYSLLSLHLGAIVQAFEPNPRYADMLERTIARNRASFGFRLSRYALSDKDGTETLYVPRELHGSASFHKLDAKWELTEIEVPTRTLKSIDAAGKYIIKIDAEGAEEKIWDGMWDALRTRSGVPATVLLEYTPGAYSEDFLDKLEAYAPLRWINYEGEEEPVTREWILGLTDWEMLVLKP